MLANNVSPPIDGTVDRRRMLAIGGSSSALTSECQAVPSAKGDVASAWTFMSSGRPSTQGAEGWMCNSPKRRPNATCWSWVMS